jgi:hypothetical protein
VDETARIFSRSPRFTSFKFVRFASVERELRDVPPERILLPAPEEEREGVLFA